MNKGELIKHARARKKYLENARDEIPFGIGKQGERDIEIYTTVIQYLESNPLAASACSCPSGGGGLEWPCPVHPPESVPENLRAAINRLLASDGSRGILNPAKCDAAHEEINRLLSTAHPVQAVPVPDDGSIDELVLAAYNEGWSAHAAKQGPEILKPILTELDRAIRKFPTWPTDPIHACKILDEEVGELSKAVLQATYEPHKSGPEEVRTEAIQAAAMAIRFIISLDKYHYHPANQHEQIHIADTPDQNIGHVNYVRKYMNKHG